MDKSTETTYRLNKSEVQQACLDFVSKQEGFHVLAKKCKIFPIMKTQEPPAGYSDMGSPIEEFVGIKIVKG